ncbi:hypothetical protein [Bacillus sp. MRMR6]|uniref:hypothetical protein n=1 Tax=Bacillus sp. MRMR6 TaxID=1928617 RepID=UPI0009521828|nr:hypothetical protein [Bacillus sp. MRMR6]OLS40729.1 hypothetical protein BTR25_07480 [Bacillus sp. MRMR6]
MSKWRIEEHELDELNYLLQKNSDVTYWQCVTRTVQESKLFPVPSYMLLSYLNAYYKWPDLLREIAKERTPEELGSRARELSTRPTTLLGNWSIPNFYLVGREMLINHDLIRPEDNLEDLKFILDFWKRFSLAYHRNNGHLVNMEATNRSKTLPERTLQVFDADLYDVEPGDELHSAASRLIATLNQYTFLANCECRVGINNDGPYNMGEGREMIIREFVDLAEGDYPWLDDLAADMPYNNLIIPIVTEGIHFHIVDGWGSFEAKPEYTSASIRRVGLYTSDYLSERYIPVSMGSRQELLQSMKDINKLVKQMIAKLWIKISTWSRDQMMDAGALVYYSSIKDLAHMAGTYRQEDWFTIDPRAERFRPMLNDEVGRDLLGEMVGILSLPYQSRDEYHMSAYSNSSNEMFSPVPYSILENHDYSLRVNEAGVKMGEGVTHLPPKTGLYTTSAGKFSLDELNEKARNFTPKMLDKKWRYKDDQWVKFNWNTSEADELYKITQEGSRNLEGKGAKLKRADIEKIRQEQGGVISK